MLETPTPKQLTSAQASNCIFPYDYRPMPHTNTYVIGNTTEVWCVRLDGDVYLFPGELEALRWVVQNSHLAVGCDVFRAQYRQPISTQGA